MGELKIGKYIKLPILGFKIIGFDFTNFIRIEFKSSNEEEWRYELEIRGKYQVRRFGREYEFESFEVDGFKSLLDFFHEEIKLCQADKAGHLWLETTKGNEIRIEDGPYENWQFKIYQREVRYKTKAHLIGGVGNTAIFKYK